MSRDLPAVVTCSWRRVALCAEHGAVPVQSSNGAPRFPVPPHERAPSTFPPKWLVFGARAEAMTTGEARGHYRSHLDRNRAKVVRELAEISRRHGGMPVALLCYEDVTRGKTCHRRWFAEWWTEQFGEEVPELTMLARK